MTNKEILEADMLDILFENRNKEYGAYALRRQYDHRLLLALGIGLSIILLFVFINMLKKDNIDAIGPAKDKDEVIIKPYEIPQDKKPAIKKEDLKPVKPKPVEKVATIKNTTMVVVPDNKVKEAIATKDDKQNSVTSTETKEGRPESPASKPAENPVGGNGNGEKRESAPSDFTPLERNPEFPGGDRALMQFLSKNLSTPDELEAGQKKTVRIRFKVDRDGTISELEIEQSAGDIFDKEVMRVCKKMPRWKPALQNGMNVPVSFVLPVTFIGEEQ